MNYKEEEYKVLKSKLLDLIEHDYLQVSKHFLNALIEMKRTL